MPSISSKLSCAARSSPDNSQQPCPIPSCRLHTNAEHVLTCNDPLHLVALSTSDSGDASFLFSNPSVRQIVDDFASCNAAVMVYVATRIYFFSDDFNAKRWSGWLLSYLQKA